MNIKVHEISKNYTLKSALHNVTVEFEAGKIHALVGENGAGKSTLANIISGDIQPTSGTLFIDQQETKFRSTKDALNKGIVLVHQRPHLASSLTARENILLQLTTDIKKRKFFLFQQPQELQDLAQKWAPGLNLKTKIKDAGGNLRFYTALLGALLYKPQCLILDEPSAFLDIQERELLYKNLGELSQSGVNIIVITHSTAEATNFSDTVTVLKEGKLSAHFKSPAAYKSALELKNKGTLLFTDGSPIQTKTEPPESRIPCFSLVHATCKPKNKPALLDATITCNYGEITAITGLKEAALDTLEDLLTGMENNYTRGTAVFWKNTAIHTQTPSLSDSEGRMDLDLKKGKLTPLFLRKNKTAIVPSDRNFRASNPELTILELLCVYNKDNDTDFAQKLIEESSITAVPEQKVSSLSGGMLQRLILARELSTNPDFIILCNPMQGLDIKSQSNLCRKLISLAAEGKSVLIAGTMDFPLSVCARVYSLESGTTKLTWDAAAEV